MPHRPQFSLDLKEQRKYGGISFKMGKAMEWGGRNKEGKKENSRKNEWSWSKSKDNVYLSFAGYIMYVYEQLYIYMYSICSLRVTELNENLKCLSDFGIYLNSLCDITMFRALERNTGALEKLLVSQECSCYNIFYFLWWWEFMNNGHSNKCHRHHCVMVLVEWESTFSFVKGAYIMWLIFVGSFRLLVGEFYNNMIVICSSLTRHFWDVMWLHQT